MDFSELLEHHLLDRSLMPLFRIGGHSVGLTYHALMMLVASAVIILGVWIAQRHMSAGRTLWSNAVEAYIVYVRDEIVRPNLGEGGDEYLPYFLTLFAFIMVCNLLGLVPWGATATGNIAVTAAMAGLTFLLMNLVGI